MDEMDDRIWEHAQKYKKEADNGIRFARFLFVDLRALSQDVLSILSDTDRDVLNLPYMRDKERVFTVVYDRVEAAMGRPIEVEEEDRYLLFKAKPQTDG
jgi:hypothetical protein